MRIVGLDHVQLAAPAGCEQAARTFFGDLLGLEELEKPDALRSRGGAWFALPDGRQLHVSRSGGGKPPPALFAGSVEPTSVGVAEPFVPATKAHPAFRVEGYDELKARLAEAGVATRDDDAIPGLRRFYVDDPFGNRLEFVENG